MEDNTLYIINECALNPSDISMTIINESVVTDNKGNQSPSVTIDTTLQSFDVVNWNNRIYGASLVMDSLDNDGMIQNDIKHGQWVGEYGHPLDVTPRRQMILYPKNCSHRILNYRREGNLLKGHVQTLLSEVGIMMANNCKLGVPASFSLRSLGSIDIATRRVKAPLKIITYDSVFRPSHIEAYQNEILSECASYIPSTDDTQKIITESAVFKKIDETYDQMIEYAKNNSTNIAIAADMFKLDRLECSLTESCTRMNIKVDDSTTINVPIESVINMQYNDILSSFVNPKGGS